MSRRLFCVLALAVAHPVAAFPAADGGVVGWVEDAKGAPVAGALVSLFGAGLRGGGFVTLSDGSGRFFLPALPAGSYTIRALGSDRVTTRQITVLPNRDSIFTLSLAAAGQKADANPEPEPTSPNERELNWLLRHKRRSVLEARSPECQAPKVADSTPTSHNLLETLVPWVPELRGAVELMAAPTATGPDQGGLDLGSPSLGSLKLDGRLADDGRWSVGGLLADRERSAWRMAAEFILAPTGSGHEFQAGAGYGSRSISAAFAGAGSGRQDNRTVGALFVSDRWTATDKLTLSGGGRYSYLGFLSDRTAFSPTLAAEYRTGEHSRVRGSVQARTLAPGGDLLTASTVQSTPAMAVAMVGDGVRPERITRHDLSADHSLGSASFGAFVFREGVRDRLVNDISGRDAGRTLWITNGAGLVAYGGGFNAAGQLGRAVKASVTYTQGRSHGSSFDSPRGLPLDRARATDGSFRDVVTRLETFVDWSGTRLVAYYRVNSWSSENDARSSPVLSQRFDVQLTQGLPFLRSMTRTEWEVLLAFRNMFYEAAEAGLLDEVAVANPPRRLVGGISVRF